MPSGNGIAAQALCRLGNLVGDARYVEAAERAVRAFLSPDHASVQCSLLPALAELIEPPLVVVLRGPQAECRAWQAAYEGEYRPHAVIVNAAELPDLPATLAKPHQGRALAYVCRATTCLAPVEERDALPPLLGNARSARFG